MSRKLALLALLLGLILIFGGSVYPSSAQGTATPTPIITPTLPIIDFAKLPVITAANADKLTEIASLSPSHVSGATWSPDGKMLAVYGKPGIWLYSLDNLGNPRYLQSDLSVGNVVFSPDSRLLADESYFEKHVTDYWESTQVPTSFIAVQLWDIASGSRVELLSNVVSPYFSTDSSTLIVQDADPGAPRLLFWNISKRMYLATLANVYLAVGSPLGDIVACAESNEDSSTTIVSVRSAKNGQVIRVLNRRGSSIDTMMIDPTGQSLLLSGTAPIQIWDIKTGKLRFQLGESIAGEINNIIRGGSNGGYVDSSFSLDGTLIGLAAFPNGHNGLVFVVDMRSGQEVDRFPTDYGSSIYFGNATIFTIYDSGSSTTYLRGTDRPQEFHGVTNPKINPTNTLIAFSRAYPDNGVVLYGIP